MRTGTPGVLPGEGGRFRLADGVVTFRDPDGSVALPVAELTGITLLREAGRLGVRLDLTRGAHTVSYTVRSRDAPRVRAFHALLSEEMAPAAPVPEHEAPSPFGATGPGLSRPVRLRRAPRALWWVLPGYALLATLSALVLADPRPSPGEVTSAHGWLLCGIVLLALARLLAWTPLVLASRGLRTRAVVVDHHITKNGVYPWYRFTTPDGTVHTEKSAHRRYGTHEVSTVTVTYDPRRPSRVAAGFPVLETVCGLLFVLAGAAATAGALRELSGLLI
ncbi:hypothetical protein ACWGNE_08745 [Streptomyces xiamenensis]